MEKFVPRLKPPQPKTLNIEEPTYAVPDVTLMFDSDDSLIWKPGENPQALIKKNKSDLLHYEFVSKNNSKNENTAVHLRLGKENVALVETKNIKELQNITVEQSQHPHNFLNSPVVSIPLVDRPASVSNFLPVSKSNKFDYNPELYISPKSVKTSAEVSESLKSCIVYHNKQEPERSRESSSNCLDNTSQNPQPSDEGMRTKAVNFQEKLQQINTGSSNYDSYKRSGNYADERVRCSSSVSKSPFLKQPSQSIGLNHDVHIMKLIEGQNQQILYLHKVLEKVLDKSNSDRFELGTQEEHYEHCSCNKGEPVNSKKKVAIVQTSFSDFKPETKTVATNTDVSWVDILCFLEDKENKRENFGKAHKSGNPLDNKTQNVGHKNRASPYLPSANRDISLTLNGIEMETACDLLSPEPSLHINVPEYEDDQCLIDNCTIDQQQNDVVERDEELNAQDFPLVGESALVYNERHKQNEAIMKHKINEETSQEPTIGTFYNNALINVRQILQETKGNEENCGPSKENHKERGNTILNTSPKKGPSANQLQLQQFGISFLDPTTLVDRRKTEPVFDTIYLPGYFQGEIAPSDLEILDGPRRERRPIASNHITDAHLVAIAQNSPGAKFGTHLQQKVRFPKDKHESYRLENDFSFATKQFLGKYELDK